MFNSQYYTCEQVDERLLQGYVDDFNEVNSTNYSKDDLLLKLFQAINWDKVFGKYEENIEFLRLYTDASKRVLWGIRVDGDIYYGAGVPSQIKSYIDSKIRELHLVNVDDILVFLDDLLDSDKTLKELLEELDIKKVDKEEGKSLIDADFASVIKYIESPEFKEVKLDANDRILEATYNDGTKLFPIGFNIGGAVLCKTLHNPEFLTVWLDDSDHLIMGFKRDGDIVFGIGVPSNIQQYVINYITLLIDDINALIDDIEERIGHYTDSNEFIDVLIDKSDRILEGHKKNGNKYFGTPVENDSSIIESKNSNKFIEVTIDNNDKIINSIDSELEDIHYGGINISEIKRDLDNDTLLTDCDGDGIIYTVENNDSTITLELDNDLNLYEVKDSYQTAEIIMEEETGDIYLEQTLKDM